MTAAGIEALLASTEAVLAGVRQSLDALASSAHRDIERLAIQCAEIEHALGSERLERAQAASAHGAALEQLKAMQEAFAHCMEAFRQEREDLREELARVHEASHRSREIHQLERFADLEKHGQTVLQLQRQLHGLESQLRSSEKARADLESRKGDLQAPLELEIERLRRLCEELGASLDEEREATKRWKEAAERERVEAANALQQTLLQHRSTLDELQGLLASRDRQLAQLGQESLQREHALQSQLLTAHERLFAAEAALREQLEKVIVVAKASNPGWGETTRPSTALQEMPFASRTEAHPGKASPPDQA